MPEVKNPFDGDVPDEALRDWLNQFEASELNSITPLLSYFRYYSSSRVFELLKVLHNKIVYEYGISIENTLFVPYGYVAKSGSAIAYFYRRQNELPQSRFLATPDLASTSLDNIAAVVFLDDFIGTGHDAVNLWHTLIAPLQARVVTCKFFFACLVGYEIGIEYAALNSDFTIIVADIVPNSERPFHADSIVYPNLEEKTCAEAILRKYGRLLAPKQPLGYGETQALVGFFFSTPNNTLPIFWSTESNWRPLLPHGESLRDPHFLLGPPRGLTEETIRRGPRRWVVELEQLQSSDIPPETSVRILREFQSTSALLVLAPIIHDLGISDEVFAHLSNLLRKLEYAVHEKEPVCTAIIVPHIAVNDAITDTAFITAREGLTIANEVEVETLSQLVNGFQGAVVTLPDGRVIGNILYPDTSTCPDEFLPQRYWAPAMASRSYNALLLLFAGQSNITLFYCGDRVLSHRGATWHIHSQAFDRALEKVASEHRLPYSVLSSVLQIAFSMADLGYGGLFTLGDEDNVLSLSDLPRNEIMTWRPFNVQDPDKRPIISLARQDGATIISSEGQVLKGMAFLRPPVGTTAHEEVGKGSKHDTAAKMSAATNTVTIAISVDGRISLYSKGNLVFKIMG